MQLAYRFMWNGLEKRVVSIKWPWSSNHDKGELLKFSRSQSNAGYEGKQRNIRGSLHFLTVSKLYVKRANKKLSVWWLRKGGPVHIQFQENSKYPRSTEFTHAQFVAAPFVVFFMKPIYKFGSKWRIYNQK